MVSDFDAHCHGIARVCLLRGQSLSNIKLAD